MIIGALIGIIVISLLLLFSNGDSPYFTQNARNARSKVRINSSILLFTATGALIGYFFV